MEACTPECLHSTHTQGIVKKGPHCNLKITLNKPQAMKVFAKKISAFELGSPGKTQKEQYPNGNEKPHSKAGLAIPPGDTVADGHELFCVM